MSYLVGFLLYFKPPFDNSSNLVEVIIMEQEDTLQPIGTWVAFMFACKEEQVIQEVIFDAEMRENSDLYYIGQFRDKGELISEAIEWFDEDENRRFKLNVDWSALAQDLQGSASGIDASGINLDNEDLRGMRLSKIILEGASLFCTCLRGAELSEANLRRARLENADLESADLSDVKLIGACLNGVNLQNAKLLRVDLTWADLRGADLRNADLAGADLKEVDLSDADLRGAKNVNLKGTYISAKTLLPDEEECFGVPYAFKDEYGNEYPFKDAEQARHAMAKIRKAMKKEEKAPPIFSKAFFDYLLTRQGKVMQ